jgi:hypothetical protein
MDDAVIHSEFFFQWVNGRGHDHVASIGCLPSTVPGGAGSTSSLYNLVWFACFTSQGRRGVYRKRPCLGEETPIMKQGAESESMTNKYTLLLVSAPLPLHVAVGEALEQTPKGDVQDGWCELVRLRTSSEATVTYCMRHSLRFSRAGFRPGYLTNCGCSKFMTHDTEAQH